MANKGNNGNAFDAGIDRARSKETTNQPSGGYANEKRTGVVGNIKSNPTQNGKIKGN